MGQSNGDGKMLKGHDRGEKKRCLIWHHHGEEGKKMGSKRDPNSLIMRSKKKGANH